MCCPIILKFGGAAVSEPAAFARIADLILERRRGGQPLVIVVSAMGSATDELFALAKQVHPNPPQRELDMLVSVGERVSISLLAMALDRRGVSAVSYTGSQAGIVTTAQHTHARIVDLRPVRIPPHLEAGQLVIVAGFQGVSESKEITTLGRGGSDTTAVALAAALGASHVEFYKDVDGVYDADPKRHPGALRLSELSYADALALVGRAEHAVLAPRCIRLAAVNAIPLEVRSFLKSPGTELGGTRIGQVGAPRPAAPVFEEEVEHAL